MRSDSGSEGWICRRKSVADSGIQMPAIDQEMTHSRKERVLSQRSNLESSIVH